MKKKIMSLLLMFCLFGSAAMTAHAETFYGDAGWQVTFTSEKEMESNFKTADLDEAVSGLQPGDNIIFTLSLKNEHSVATDWYMTNKVLYSLEDRSANTGTSGGAYTYVLTYTGKDGKKNVLFSSSTIGGDSVSKAGEGLHEATNALKDYFYLDTLSPGQSGKITLEVALDGETQGNDYQDTLADLQMNFAVELSNTQSRSNNASSRREVVRTGDETRLIPYFIAMAVSGGLCLYLAMYNLKQNKKEEDEGKGAK